MKKIEQIRLLLSGLASADSIGSTTEFKDRSAIPAIYERYKAAGWPFKAVGGGAFNWRPGEPTDDTEMAMCLIESYLDLNRFDAEDVGNRFVKWAQSGPRDIGGTTSRTLARLADGAQWYNAGKDFFLDHPLAAGNGGLMRNGIVPGIATTLDEAFEFSLKQGIITHYHPLSVLSSAAQVWIIWQLLEGMTKPLDGNWFAAFEACWESWLSNAFHDDPRIRQWYQTVMITNDGFSSTFDLLREADWNFNPLTTEERLGGYVFTTLQVALWALRWAARTDDVETTVEGLPEAVSKKRGAYCIGWPVFAGGDTDSYCAVAGPMISALCGEVPTSMTANLTTLQEFDTLVAQSEGKQ